MKSVILPLLQALTSLMASLLQSLLKCHHLHAKVQEGKCYCPDCGEGLIYQWMVLRCGHCRTRRPSRKILGQIAPKHRHCSQCGAQDTQCHTLSSPAYYQLDYAHLIQQKNVPTYASLSNIVVWVNSWVGLSLRVESKQSSTQTFTLLQAQKTA